MSECRFVSGALSKGRTAFMRHPLTAFILLGLAVRLLLMCTAGTFDAEYWGIVVRNIETGNGLYEANGYYYTPVWGYVLGLVSAFQDAVLSLGDSAVRVYELIPAEGAVVTTSVTATSVLFNFCTKIPMMLVDLLMGYLVYVLVRDMGGSREKAVFAFALAWMSPVLLMSTGVIGMPDTLAATFTILAVVLLRRGQSFFAGLAFALGVLTKFFPLFLLFVLVAYLVSKYKGDAKRIAKEAVFAVSGAVLAFVAVFFPQAAEGNLPLAFQFLTDRLGIAGISQTKFLLIIVLGVAALIVLAVLVVRLSDAVGKRRAAGKKIGRKTVLYVIAVAAVAVIALLAFAFSKIQSSGSTSAADSIVSNTRVIAYVFILILSILLAKHFYRSQTEDLDRNLVKYSFLTMASCMLYPPVTQYLCVVVPFLAYYIAMCDRKCMVSWKLLGLGSVLATCAALPTMLLPLAAWTDVIEMSSISHLLDVFLAGPSVFNIWCIVLAAGSVMQYFGVLSIFWVMFGRNILGKRGSEAEAE